jgi:signal transduction histidine kinase
MPSGVWFRPPRHVLALFLLFAFLPAIAVGWLTWRLLQQEQTLENQRVVERLENAADLLAATLQRNLAELEERLNALALSPGAQLAESASQLASSLDDAVMVVFHTSGIESYPAARLLYYPFLPRMAEPPASLFESAEALEFKQNDPARAAAAFRELARSSEPLVRASALLPLGRNLRKAGRSQEALLVYEELTRLGTTPVRGLPAELLARQARCALLEQVKQLEEAQREAQALHDDLHRGRWRLTRTAYRFYAQEARRLVAGRDDRAVEAREHELLALASGVESAWEEWQALQRGEGNAAGRRNLRPYGRFNLLLWRSGPERVVALAAGPRFLESQWLKLIEPLSRRQRVKLALADAEGHPVAGEPAAAPAPQIVRAAADTRLPWNLRVASLSPSADFAELLARRRLLLAGFALMAMVILAGSYLSARAVARELEGARLKSDFVSAVSHEFRTPLTALCQLAELFAQGRVADEAQRQQYYGLLAGETRRLRRLVESLLDFGRMEGGARQYRLESVDAAALVRETVSEFQAEVGVRGYRVELNIAEPEFKLRADPEALRRALWNLLDNAVKYSPQCQTVWVEALREEECLAIRVRDRGLGIPASEQNEVFKKFMRGSSSRATGVKGTGIGLSMVEHIVRGHHGKVTVESAPGAGSTFTMLLPLEG